MAFFELLPAAVWRRKHGAEPDARALAFRQPDHASAYLDTGGPESVPGHEGRGF
jgi:hypothetical protein